MEHKTAWAVYSYDTEDVTHLTYPLSSDAVVEHTLSFEYSESGVPSAWEATVQVPIYNNSTTRV